MTIEQIAREQKRKRAERNAGKLEERVVPEELPDVPEEAFEEETFDEDDEFPV